MEKCNTNYWKEGNTGLFISEYEAHTVLDLLSSWIKLDADAIGWMCMEVLLVLQIRVAEENTTQDGFVTWKIEHQMKARAMQFWHNNSPVDNIVNLLVRQDVERIVMHSCNLSSSNICPHIIMTSLPSPNPIIVPTAPTPPPWLPPSHSLPHHLHQSSTKIDKNQNLSSLSFRQPVLQFHLLVAILS